MQGLGSRVSDRMLYKRIIGILLTLPVFFIGNIAFADTQMDVHFISGTNFNWSDATVPNDLINPRTYAVTAFNKYFGTYPDTSTSIQNASASCPSGFGDGGLWSYYNNDSLESLQVGNGDYWIKATECTTGNIYYIKFHRYSSSNWVSIGPTDPTVPTKILNQISPLAGSVSTSTVVNFAFTYWFNDTIDFGHYTKAGYTLKNITAGIELASTTQSEADISAGGQNRFDTWRQLTEGNLYAWTPYLRNASSTDFLRGNTIFFDVQSRSASYDSATSTINAVESASSTSILPLLPFAGLYDTMVNIVPFTYYFDVYSAMHASSTPDQQSLATSTFTVNTGGVNFSATVLAKSTVEKFMTVPTQHAFRTLITASLWVLTAFYVWRRSTHIITIRT